MSITAIVPLKALRRSKQRLAGRLADEEREALVATVFRHVVSVCRAATPIDEVVAVIGDDAGAALARAAGAAFVREPVADLNRAVAHATARCHGAASLVVVADLPELTAVDLERVADAGRHGPCVIVARTIDGGTGALLRRPVDVIAPAFGQASAGAHLDAGRRAGVRVALVASPGLARDLDRPEDLDRYVGSDGRRTIL